MVLAPAPPGWRLRAALKSSQSQTECLKLAQEQETNAEYEELDFLRKVSQGGAFSLGAVWVVCDYLTRSANRRKLLVRG